MKVELLVIAVYQPAVNLSLKAVQIARHAPPGIPGALSWLGTNFSTNVVFPSWLIILCAKGGKVVTKSLWVSRQSK